MKSKLVNIDLNKSPLSTSKNIALAVAQIILWGSSFFILSVLADPIMKETNWSNQMIYGVLSLSLLVSGIASSHIGKIINENENDYILLYSGFVMALGLTISGLSQHFLVFILGWLIIGISMGMGLYDALFALLGKKHGIEAKKAILQITLISGFAPTVSWFIISHLLNYFNWRTICFIYSFILLISIYPLHRFGFEVHQIKNKKTNLITQNEVTSNIFHLKIFRLLLIYFTIGAILMTGIVIHLIDILLSKKMSLATAVSIAALLGPSQVGVRVLDLIFSKKTPEKTAIISAISILIGLSLLLISSNIAFLGVIIFGLGNGMRSILKGTLPLVIFGQRDYAQIMGKLAGLPLIAQAVTPLIGGLLIQQFSTSVFIIILSILAFVNVLLAINIQNLNKQKIR